VLYQATKGIADLIAQHGLVNLDFADVRTIMRGMGEALMGTGCGEGDSEKRAVMAAEAAIHNPLLDDISISGARGILINVTGGTDMTLCDVSEATRVVNEAVGTGEGIETNIIFGAVTDPSMNGKIRVTVIATGFNEQSAAQRREAAVNSAGSKEAEKKVEQITMPLQFPLRREKAEYTKEHHDEGQGAAAGNPPPAAAEEHQSAGTSGASALDFPPFLKPEAMRKEPLVYVSKGSVMTQYEDDTNIPTFLRKQMQ